MGRLTQALAMGVGTAGAMVDVTSFVDLQAGVSRSWGRRSEWEDTSPGTFSFTVDNSDGRFTPANPASAFPTPVVEGTTVCWQLGSRLVAGAVLGVEPTFPGDNAAWSQVDITVDDMLGNAGRVEIDNLPQAMIQAATAYAYWPMNEESDQFVAHEVCGTLQPSLQPSVLVGWTPQSATFGYPGVPGTGETQALIRGDGTSITEYFRTDEAFKTISYPAGSIGSWGFWATPVVPTSTSNSSYFNFYVQLANGNLIGFQNTTAAGVLSVFGFIGSSLASTTISGTVAFDVSTPLYLSMIVTHTSSQVSATFYANGVSLGSVTRAAVTTVTDLTKQPSSVVFLHADDAGLASTSYAISHLSHTQYQVHEEYLTSKTETGRARAIGSTVAGMSLSTPTGLSGALVDTTDFDGSALEALNAVALAEQGYLYTTTSGTLLDPTQTAVLRGRDRPVTVSASYNTELDLAQAPELIRDLGHQLARVDVKGPSATVTVYDNPASNRAGTDSESVVLASSIDLYAWGQDRIIRGKVNALQIRSVVVDAMTTTVDRSSDLLAHKPGDRIRVTNLPTSVLGYSTYDGWLVGVDENHSLTEHTFDMAIAAVLPAVSVYDTDRWSAGGALNLSSAVTASATSMSVASTTAGVLLSTVSTPYTLLIDSEQVTVTACTGATPQVLTVTRGANGSTAAAHSSGALVDITPTPTYAF